MNPSRGHVSHEAQHAKTQRKCMAIACMDYSLFVDLSSTIPVEFSTKKHDANPVMAFPSTKRPG